MCMFSIRGLILPLVIAVFICPWSPQSDAIAQTSKSNIGQCSSVDRNTSTEFKRELALEVAKQLQSPNAEILAVFRIGDWRVIYADPHDADEVFLFYSQTPITSRYLKSWSGAATSDDESELKNWAVSNVPGIPSELASCFAWYVTQGRTK